MSRNNLDLLAEGLRAASLDLAASLEARGVKPETNRHSVRLTALAAAADAVRKGKGDIARRILQDTCGE